VKLANSLVIIGLSFATIGLAAEQQTAKKAAPAKSKQETGMTSAKVVEMLQAGLSDDLVIRTLKRENRAFDLSPDDMIGLKKQGVPDRVIQVMLDPSAEPAETVERQEPAPAGAAVPASTEPIRPQLTVNRKRRVAVFEFDDSAVARSVEQIFGTRQNVGRGLQALMVKRLVDRQTFHVLERSKINTVMKEQDLGSSNRVKQGTNARIGRIIGSDALIFGDFVQFGRDDHKTDVRGGGLFGRAIGAGASAFNTSKAVIVVNFRIVDAESGEIIYTGESKGEAERRGNAFGALAGALGTGVAGVQVDMTSAKFAETIVGEAMINCVDKLVAELIGRVQTIPVKKIGVEARIADVAGSTVTIAAGSDNGVETNDRFEVLRIVREVKDPTTQEVLDVITETVGELLITGVRERVATGAYTGSVPAEVNFAVRRKL
jgi:curli biogenesis system outer membrane secretion channel CsgG